MSSLVIIPSTFVLLLLVIVMACLVYLGARYRAEIRNLLAELDQRERIAKEKAGLRKLYTYDSDYERIEDVVLWRVVDQQLRLTMKDGSLFVVEAPSRYKFIIQEQPEEEPV